MDMFIIAKHATTKYACSVHQSTAVSSLALRQVAQPQNEIKIILFSNKIIPAPARVFYLSF
jgi:hypothetical protein